MLRESRKFGDSPPIKVIRGPCAIDFALANNIFHTANISDNKSWSALILVSFESAGVALSNEPVITVSYHCFVEL